MLARSTTARPSISKQIAAGGWSDDQLARAVSDEAHRPFDLERTPVVRVRLFTRANRDHILLVTLHHIAYDLWSMMTLLNELGTLYAAYVAGATPSLPAPRPYEEFARWQADMLAGPEGERLWKYWRGEMAGEIPVLTLPTDRPRPAFKPRGAATLHVSGFPAPLSAALRDLAQAKGHTLFTLLLSAFEVLLARYSGEDDIVVGSPMTGRSRPELPGRRRLLPQHGAAARRSVRRSAVHRGAAPHAAGRAWRARTPGLSVCAARRAAATEAQSESQHVVPRDVRAQQAAPPRGSGSVGLDGRWRADRTRRADPRVLRPSRSRPSSTISCCWCRRSMATLSAPWQYNTDLFDESTIVRMAGHYERLLESIVVAPEARISELSMMSDERAEALVSGGTRPGRPYPTAVDPSAFRGPGRAHPEASRRRYGDGHLTYDELNRRANQLAQVLRTRGVGPDVLVGLLRRALARHDRRPARHSQGGRRLPAARSDVSTERLAFMMQDTAASLCWSPQEALLGRLPDGVPAVVCLDRDRATIALEDDANPPAPSRPSTLPTSSTRPVRPAGRRASWCRIAASCGSSATRTTLTFSRPTGSRRRPTCPSMRRRSKSGERCSTAPASSASRATSRSRRAGSRPNSATRASRRCF